MVNAFVHIIESPSDQDLLDGRTEGRSLCEALRLANIPGWYSLATTRRTFQDCLNNRLIEAHDHFGKTRMPILHLSMHGNRQGVALTDNTFIGWEELKRCLQPLNNALQGGLLICLSACFSVSGIRMAMFEGNDHPFWGLVGHPDSAEWADAALAYTTFYHRLFKGANVDEAVIAMHAASGDARFMWFRGHDLKNDWVKDREEERKRQLSQGLGSLDAGTFAELLRNLPRADNPLNPSRT